MKKKRLWLVWIPILLLVAIGAYVLFGTDRESAVEVLLDQVETADLKQSITVSGTLAAADSEDIPVLSTRKVAVVHVKEGDRVQAGDLLVEFDTADLLLQRERLLLSVASLQDELAEIASPTLRSDVANTRSRVSQLTLSLENTTRQLREAEERLATDQSLFSAGALSAQALDASRLNRDNLANSVAQAQQALAAARADASDVTAGKSLQQSALERQLDGVSIDLERVLLQIEDSRIVADMSGEILDLPLVEGRFPFQGSTVRIRDLSRWDAVVYLTQEDAVQVSPGQSAELSIKGLSGTWPATVSEIAREAVGEAGSGSRTPKVKVTLRVAAEEARFASGYDVEVSIETGSVAGANAVPKEALMQMDDGSFRVLAVDATSGDNDNPDSIVTGRIRFVPVEPGLETNSLVDIGAALPAGSLIVLPPVDDPAEGLLVKGTVAK